MESVLSQPLVAVVVLLGVLVFVHELGHFAVGKACGIGVETFSIGFGPRLLSFTHRHTCYQIALIPLGGFVKFTGALSSEDVPQVFAGKEFHSAPNWARALTLLAGPGANFLLAIAVFAWLGGRGIEHPPAIVGQVLPGSAAEEAGLMAGDKIRAVDQTTINTWEDFRSIVSESPERRLSLLVERGSKELHVPVVPSRVRAKNLFGNDIEVGRVGIGQGFIPPIVTVISVESAAYRAGLRTGDRVEAVGGDAQDSSIDYMETATWSQVGYFLARAGQAGAERVYLKVTRPGAAEPIQLTLDWDSERVPGVGGATGLTVSTYERYAKDLGLEHAGLTVGAVREPASQSLMEGDQFVRFAGEEVRTIFDLGAALEKNREPNVAVDVMREGHLVSLELALKATEEQLPEGRVTVYRLDADFMGAIVSPDPYIEAYSSLPGAIWFGIKKCVMVSGAIVSTLWGLITGDVPVQVLGGPIMIAQVAQDSVKRGIEAFVTSMALISINLAVINLFPIPVLDGGQLVLVAAQSIRRRPLSELAIENFHKVGFVMILALVVLAMYNDLSRYWASMVSSMVGFFQ